MEKKRKHIKKESTSSEAAKSSPMGGGQKVIGIIGNEGAYGKWLTHFFEGVGCKVIGSDTRNPAGLTNKKVIAVANVVVFSVPMDQTEKIIEEVIDNSREDQLWLDITSLKSGPIDAMLKSRAEVIGIHPMVAPTVASWKGQTVVVCPIRNRRWLDWLLSVLGQSGGTIKLSSPESHDKYMAVVQALPHALCLIMAATLCNLRKEMKIDVAESQKYSTPPFRLIWSTLSRIFSLNPSLYADIQICNKANTVAMLKSLAAEAEKLSNLIESSNKEKFESEFDAHRTTLGLDNIDEGSALFDQLVRITADLSEENSILIQSKKDHPGLLYEILQVFSDSKLNLTSLHSFRAENAYRFQIGFEKRRKSREVQSVITKLRNHVDLGDKIEFLPL